LKPLAIWTGVIACVLVGVISLSVLVHRQWADRERIRYPIAEMASSLLRQDESGLPAILRNRLFWIGLSIPLFIRLTHGIHLWAPNSIVIPLNFDFSALRVKFPEFMRTPGANYLSAVTLYPAVIGFTFLLASEIGLSLGIANLVSVFVLYILLTAGLDVSGGSMEGSVLQWQNFGSFLAAGLMLVYIGRRYYWQTLREAVTFVRGGETGSAPVWAFRVLLLCVAGAIAILAFSGLDWPLAALGVLLTLLLFLVCARLNAECGTFFFAPAWTMPAIWCFGTTTSISPAAAAVTTFTKFPTTECRSMASGAACPGFIPLPWGLGVHRRPIPTSTPGICTSI
jgi:hypothetical protein